MTIQGFQIKDDAARSKLGSTIGEELDNKWALMEDKISYPLDVTISGDTLTVDPGTVQKLESDGADSTQNAYKWRLPLISGVDVSPAQSTLDLTNGNTTGDFSANPESCPAMTASFYIQMGIELRSDGKFYVVFGNEDAVLANTTAPSFTTSSLQVAVIKLQDSGGGGSWNFDTPAKEDIEIVVRGSTGGAGAGAGLGSNLDGLSYLSEWEDSFSNEDLVDSSAGYTTASFDGGSEAYGIQYDTSKPSTWGMAGGDAVANLAWSKSPAFTVKAGDVVIARLYQASGTAAGSLSGNELETTGNIFDFTMVGQEVWCSTHSEKAKIVEYISATKVKLDREIDGTQTGTSDWSGDAVAVLSKPHVRKIITITDQTPIAGEITLEAAFSVALIDANVWSVTVSQCVHTVDIPTYWDSGDSESIPGVYALNPLYLENVSAGAADSVDFRQQTFDPAADDVILQYNGGAWRETVVSSLTDDETFELADTTNMADGIAACIPKQSTFMVSYLDDGLHEISKVGFNAITGSDSAGNWDDELGKDRGYGIVDNLQEYQLGDSANAGAHLYIRFFSNIFDDSQDSGTVYLNQYKAYFYRQSTSSVNGGISNQSYGVTNNIGTNKGMFVDVYNGKTRITLDWVYSMGENEGFPFGDLIVTSNGQEVPREIDDVLTTGIFYTEHSSTQILLDTDYSSVANEVAVYQRIGGGAGATSAVDEANETDFYENILPNSNFDQNHNGSYWATGANYDVDGPCGWTLIGGTTEEYSIETADPPSGSNSYLRLALPSGTGDPGIKCFLGPEKIVPLQGKRISFSCLLKRGAGFVNDQFAMVIHFFNKDFSASAGTSAECFITPTDVSTTEWTRVGHDASHSGNPVRNILVPSGAEAMVVYIWTAGSQTGGATVWYELAQPQIEVASDFTYYRIPKQEDDLTNSRTFHSNRYTDYRDVIDFVRTSNDTHGWHINGVSSFASGKWYGQDVAEGGGSSIGQMRNHLGENVYCAFDGTNDFIASTGAASTALQTTGSFYVGGNFYKSDWSSWSAARTLFSQKSGNSGWISKVYTDGRWAVQLLNGAALILDHRPIYLTDLSSGWHHLAIVIKADTPGTVTQVTWYVDSYEVAQWSGTWAFAAGGDFEIGSFEGGTDKWNGGICDVFYRKVEPDRHYVRRLRALGSLKKAFLDKDAIVRIANESEADGLQVPIYTEGTNGWSTNHAEGLIYYSVDGQKRFRFNLQGDVTSGARTNTRVYLKNVYFNQTQAVACGSNASGAYLTRAVALGGFPDLYVNHASATTVYYIFSGDVRIQ